MGFARVLQVDARGKFFYAEVPGAAARAGDDDDNGLRALAALLASLHALRPARWYTIEQFYVGCESVGETGVWANAIEKMF